MANSVFIRLSEIIWEQGLNHTAIQLVRGHIRKACTPRKLHVPLQ